MADVTDGVEGHFRLTWEDLLIFCLAKPGAWQDEPWEGDVVVKVGARSSRSWGPGRALRWA
jgi:hypothetical protein